MSEKLLRIGGASGFWGDAARATPQLLTAPELDYIVYDYLAEITMSIMARARAKDDTRGYAADFVTAAMAPNLATIAERGIKVVSNAGGVNPGACVAALRQVIADQGLDLKVACISGDDLMPQKTQVADTSPVEMFSRAAFPTADSILSMNAYLGAFPIAQALQSGADIVVTGRCVDSAVTLGACIAAFGWERDDYDRLAMGSLAGHILECGPQATGGNFTDWESVTNIENIGYPIAEIAPDGSFTCTKPENTGGLVGVGTVSEQMLYEIGDPQAYLLPDVSCDFSTARLEQQGEHRVHVTGATGTAPPPDYKVSATFLDQFRGGTYMTFYGEDANRKAQALGDAVFAAARNTLSGFGMADFSETSIELLGMESQFGAFSNLDSSREVVMKIAAKHEDARGIGILLKEAVGLGLATPPGLSGFAGSRPSPSPVVRLFSFSIPRSEVPVSCELDGSTQTCDEHTRESASPQAIQRPATPEPPVDDAGDTVSVPASVLAWGRSGDKGDKANVGIIARDPRYLPYLWASLTEDCVKQRFAHFLAGTTHDPVERFLLPGSHSINFLLHDVLGGGGVASIRNDPQGKGYAQVLLATPIEIPRSLSPLTSNAG